MQQFNTREEPFQTPWGRDLKTSRETSHEDLRSALYLQIEEVLKKKLEFKLRSKHIITSTHIGNVTQFYVQALFQNKEFNLLLIFYFNNANKKMHII